MFKVNQVKAKVKCKACDGVGSVIKDEPEYFYRNDDGSERCFPCQGKGYTECWIGIDEILRENLIMQKAKEVGIA